MLADMRFRIPVRSSVKTLSGNLDVPAVSNGPGVNQSRLIGPEPCCRITFHRAVLSRLLAVAVAGILLGCEAESNNPPPQAANPPKQAISGALCENVLANAMSSLQPDRLGISAERQSAVTDLNDWGRSCGNLQNFKIDEAGRRILADLLSAEQIESLEGNLFLQRDSLHIRNCLWGKQIVSLLSGSADSDLGRVVKIFEYVVRNVDLIAAKEDHVPLTPFELALMGRGTAEDRAWIFTDILRQLRIDSVIIRPATGSPADGETADGETPSATTGDTWLVGVLLEGDMWLFDPRLGTPVPAINDANKKSPLFIQPATLKQALEDDSIFRQLDVSPELTYPLQAANLKDIRIDFIGQLSYWSPRMHGLQDSLSGEQSVLVYDPLEDNETGPGGFSRVSESVKASATKTQFGVWDYPERQTESYVALDSSHADLAELNRGFSAPIPIAAIEEPTLKLDFSEPQFRQLKSRTLQLMGDYGSAVKNYLTVRLWGGVPPQRIDKESQATVEQRRARDVFVPIPMAYRQRIAAQVPADILAVHRLAAEDAYFWIGVCQLEKGDLESATETFESYQERFSDGMWNSAARYLRAVSLAKSDRLKEAVHVLSKTTESDPQYWGHMLLIRHWKTMTEAQ